MEESSAASLLKARDTQSLTKELLLKVTCPDAEINHHQ